jgi:plasmid maintenance system antidote protein VapI
MLLRSREDAYHHPSRKGPSRREVLREEFMIPYGTSASALARALDVPVNRVTAQHGMHINERVQPRAA